MPNEIIITLITTMGGILIAVLAKLGKIGRDASAARDQVQNNHEPNLRDDIDDKHDVVDTKLDLILDVVKGLQESDRNQWSAIEKLRRRRFL